jgi:hypothetical protein
MKHIKVKEQYKPIPFYRVVEKLDNGETVIIVGDNTYGSQTFSRIHPNSGAHKFLATVNINSISEDSTEEGPIGWSLAVVEEDSIGSAQIINIKN